MSLSLSQKSHLYRDLGTLLRSGKPFPASVQMLYGTTSGSVRALLGALYAAVNQGRTVGEAFVAQYPQVSHLEVSIASASARSGKLDQGCLFLSEYYQQLAAARKSIIGKLLYPAFILHVGILVTGLPALVLSGDVMAYLKGSVITLVVLYLYLFSFALLTSLLLKLGSTRSDVDRGLRMIPGFGKLRRAYALSRFCTTYEMQLQSGVNVMDSLASAGKASQSGLINAAVAKAVPQVRAGAQVGQVLQGNSGAFTLDLLRGIQIGEETGTLDGELKRMAGEYQQEATTRLDFLAAFTFKAIYILILLYVGLRLVLGYVNYLNAAMHSVDSMSE